MDGLRQQLLSWDGKSTDVLKQLAPRFRNNEHLAPTLIAFLGEPQLQKGASWLLKNHLDGGGSVDRTSCSAIVRQLSGLKHWEADLHVLQCVAHLEIARDDRLEFEEFLERCIASKNKFVRAWAYNGYYELSRQYPEYRESVGHLLQQGLESEPASVKARIRNILKKEKAR